MHAEQQLVEQMQFALVPITELNVLVYMDSKEILLPHADHCPCQLNLAWMWVAPPMMNVLTILHAKTDSV